jgi:site-specific DNA-methyltransferase (adenine-specific)
MVTSRLLSKFKTISGTNQRVSLGDCLNVLSSLEERSIDIFVTSPPYNIGINYGTYQDDKSSEEYLSCLHNVFYEAKRTLKDDGSLFLNIGNTSKNPNLAFNVANCLRDLFHLQNNFIWVKSIAIDFITYGHFTPINSHRFVNNNFEHVYHFTKNGNVKINKTAIGTPYMDKRNIARKADSLDLRCRGNTWFIPYETIQNKSQKGYHPAIYPKQLVENCIKLAGYDDDTVVCDPFLGSGTTLVVAEQLGINGFGIELDEVYLKYAEKRIAA